MLSFDSSSLSAVLSAQTIGDPESTRRVYTTIVVLVVLGVVMLALAVWLFRRTRPEPHLLAPLELMDTRRWRRSEPAQRGRELDEKRPPGARPLRRAAERPLVDSDFDTTQPVRSFDDLAPGADADGRSSDDTDVARRRSSDTADPTPTDDDAFTFASVAPTASDGAASDDTGEQLRTGSDDADPDEADADTGDEDARESVTPGEGRLRRGRDLSS